MMKRLFVVLLLVFTVFAQKREFIREYNYIASEFDSKVTARQNASDQMRALLLQEIGQVVIAEQRMERGSSHNQFIYEDYSEKITAVAASMVNMVILNENWTGARYFIRAKITVDPSEVSQRANEVLLNHSEMRQLRDQNRDVLQQVDRLNNELLRLRTRMQDSENFLFGEINEYKLKLAEMMTQVNRLTQRNTELIGRHAEEIENYKSETLEKDSIIESLKISISELQEELRTAQSRQSQSRQVAAAPREEGNFIRINTVPAGALIYVNDRYVGKTPHTHNDPPHGRTSVRVRLSGHKQHTWDINYQGGQQILRKTLERSAQ
jgi:chromosome segregation ATPase